MAMNIKNEIVERLAREVALLAGETKTQAVRRALEERKVRLAPASEQGRRGDRLSRVDREAILGYGKAGVSDHLVVGPRSRKAGLRPALHQGSRGKFLSVLAEDRRGGPADR